MATNGTGAKRTVAVDTLILTAQLNGLDPDDDFREVPARIRNGVHLMATPLST
jgi:hypothetical protein